MLVLTRRSGQSIRIGPNVEVRVVRIEGDRVVLGIAAPRHVAVVRAELIEQVSDELLEASDARAKLRVMLRGWTGIPTGMGRTRPDPPSARCGPAALPSVLLRPPVIEWLPEDVGRSPIESGAGRPELSAGLPRYPWRGPSTAHFTCSGPRPTIRR